MRIPRCFLPLFLLTTFPLSLLSQPIDGLATARTQALYRNLLERQGKGIMFGHQDDLAYGIGWKGGRKRSDVEKTSGSYPAVFGWELSKLGQRDFNIDTVEFGKMRKWIRRGYDMGGIITISWHIDNPATGGSSWDNTPALATILPGGEHHNWYKEQLGLVADFMTSLTSGGELIPVVFRPFHEQTGGWFWWGRPHRSPQEYVALWRFTVLYMADSLNVHNLLYAYSPDIVSTQAEYLLDYPGDNYIDILGLDDYADFRPGGDPAMLPKRLRMVGELAMEKGKPFALTETGANAIPQPDWWTQSLLKNITADPVAAKASWMLVWRNARLDHHFGPFPGHGSAADFIRFVEDDRVLMAEDVDGLYE